MCGSQLLRKCLFKVEDWYVHWMHKLKPISRTSSARALLLLFFCLFSGKTNIKRLYINFSYTQYSTGLHFIGFHKPGLVRLVLWVNSDTGTFQQQTWTPAHLQLMAGLLMCQNTYWARDRETQNEWGGWKDKKEWESTENRKREEEDSIKQRSNLLSGW